MGVHSSRFEVAATSEDDPAGSPLLNASLCWEDQDGQARTTQAMILLSWGDRLLLLADKSPPLGGLAVVRLGWPLPAGWATGVVSRSRCTRLGPWEIELTLVGRPSAAFRMLRRDDPDRH